MDKLELQESSRGAQLSCVIHALHCLEPGGVLGRSSPGTSDCWTLREGSLGTKREAEHSDSLALCCVSSIICLLWDNMLFLRAAVALGGQAGHLHMALIKSSGT